MADWNDIALAAWNTAAQLGTAAVSYGTHKADRKFNAEQARIQREFQLEMWNKANAYNSPSAQMERFKEAGLNPNLIYGDGATTLAAHVGNAASASAPADSTRYPDLGAALLGAVQAAKTKAEIDYVQSEELVNRERAKNLKIEREGVSLENMFNRDSYDIRLSLLNAEFDLKTELSGTEVAKRNQIQSECEYLAQQSSYLESKTQNEKDMTKAELKKIDTDIDNSIKVASATVTKLNADARKANADAWLAGVEAQVLNDTENNQKFKDAKIQKMVNDAKKSLEEGNEAEINSRILALKEELYKKGMPMRRILSTIVDPVTETLGKVFSGAFSFGVRK